MKKNLLNSFLIAGLVLGLVACDKKDETTNTGGSGGSNSTDLVGTWNYKSANFYSTANGTVVLDSTTTQNEDEEFPSKFVFTKDSAFITYLDNGVAQTERFAYTFTGSLLIGSQTSNGVTEKDTLSASLSDGTFKIKETFVDTADNVTYNNTLTISYKK